MANQIDDEAVIAAPNRAVMLRQSTTSIHETVDNTIMDSGALESVDSYRGFVRFQYQLMLDVEPLYRRADLARIIPDLAARSRLAAAERDAADLGISLPREAGSGPDLSGIGAPEALGWLYVVEGSNLGAAFLAKAVARLGLSAENGAAHLAASPEGRAAHWRGFTEALNAVSQTDDEDRRMADAAKAAFARVRELIAVHLDVGREQG